MLGTRERETEFRRGRQASTRECGRGPQRGNPGERKTASTKGLFVEGDPNMESEEVWKKGTFNLRGTPTFSKTPGQ